MLLNEDVDSYATLLEYDLKRQKQKNVILEERLKNKETFIIQMKEFQEQLSEAYEKCKNELIDAISRINKYESVQKRQLLEENVNLRHAVTRNSQRNSFQRRKNIYPVEIQAPIKQKSTTKSNFQSNMQSNTQSNTYRSKSLLKNNNTVNVRETVIFNFSNQFIDMAASFNQEINAQTKLSKKLKMSWKWIKNVVREWQIQSPVAKKQNKSTLGITNSNKFTTNNADNVNNVYQQIIHEIRRIFKISKSIALQQMLSILQKN